MKSYKTEIVLNDNQQQHFYKTIGVCRFIYNLFIDINKERYEYEQPFMNNFTFSKWLNNLYLKQNPDKLWIKEVSTKAILYALLNANKAFKQFFVGNKKYPSYKSRRKNNCKMHFVRADLKYIIKIDRHRINIPTLGWIKIKEYGYLPTKKAIISGTVSFKAGRFYVSVITNEANQISQNNYNPGIGIDVGVKDLAICSNGMIFKNINKSNIVKNINKKLKREQRALSRKFINTSEHSRNIEKNILRIQKIYQKLTNIRNDYQNKVVNEIVRTKPSYITIENLNIKGMIKNKYLSRAINEQKLNRFFNILKAKAINNSIELRQVNQFYPSSKKCSRCGIIKKDLKLSDRTYICECGLNIDRDLNASINLCQASKYQVV